MPASASGDSEHIGCRVKLRLKIGNLASTLGPLEPSVSGSTACGRPDSYQKLL